MDSLLFLVARGLVALIQSFPLVWVARIGRFFGELFWWLDGRHRRIAIGNLSLSFPSEYSPEEIKALAHENFRRLGENYFSAIKTSSMDPAALAPHFELVGSEKVMMRDDAGQLPSRIVAIGHFGNFELYARFSDSCPQYQCATTYRGLEPPALDRIMQKLRAKSGCHFFERRRDGAALKAAMADTGFMLGLLSDQHAGDCGLRIPFFGRDCSTTPAPAIFARRYNCRLHVAICYRVALAKWRIEISDAIPTGDADHGRSSKEIMMDVNNAFEAAIRRDPANWFWVHRRWKPAPPSRGRVCGEEEPVAGAT